MIINTNTVNIYNNKYTPEVTKPINSFDFASASRPKTLPHTHPNSKILDVGLPVNPSVATPTSRPTFDHNPIANAIREAVGVPAGLQDPMQQFSLHFADTKYVGYTMAEMKWWVKDIDKTDKYSYVSEFRDCDDYVSIMKGEVSKLAYGVPLGWIWYFGTTNGSNWGHAVNIFYDYLSDTAVLIEPQNDTFYEFDKSWTAGLCVI